MKAYLMHRNEDLDLERELPLNEAALVQDLELSTLFDAMALGDKFLLYVAERVVSTSLTDPKAIVYREQVLADCLEQPAVVREIYGIAVDAIQAEKKIWGWGMGSPTSILHTSVQVLELFVGFLKRLRVIADEHGSKFRSEGFTRLFAMLAAELDDDYFRTIEAHLKELRFRQGMLMTAELGKGNKGVHYVLRRLPRPKSWLERISQRGRPGYSFEIAPRDESGFAALAQLQGKGINLVANALAQSADHILSFLSMLRAELAFYIGCLNLRERLADKGEPTCFPVTRAGGQTAFSARGLYDVCLTLHLEGRVVGSDVDADGKSLVMITGANQGGKSTFLRGVGLAHLMMQSGMFVAAQSFAADVCDGIFTHFKREEDSTMESGKLDEELSRMSDIADLVTSNCIVLCNESFAATNEREGSEIARQVVRALMEANVKVFFVTHLFDLANGFFLQELDTALFLRAERYPDGRRTCRLVKGQPLPTSHGEDAYRRIFGTPEATPTVAETHR